MPCLSFCCLPGGLRRLVSAGWRGLPLGGEPGPAGRRGRFGLRRQAGGGARLLLLLPCPLEAAARTPGSGARPRRGLRRPGVGSDQQGLGGGASAPFASPGNARRQGRVAFGLGEFGDWGSPVGPELRGGGCSLGVGGFSGPGPGPPRQTDPRRL